MALSALVLAGCDDVWKHYAGGVSGHSFKVADQFVILNNGYKQGDVTWVVVRNWPSSSSPDARRSDSRLQLSLEDGEYYVSAPDRERTRPDENTAYVFDGSRLASFKIRMKEDDFIGFRAEDLRAYPDVETFLRRFERKESPK